MPSTTLTLHQAKILGTSLKAHEGECPACHGMSRAQTQCKTCDGHGVVFIYQSTTFSASAFLLLCRG